MFSEDEIMQWEVEQREMELGRWCPEKHRRAFDPDKDRLFKARNRLTLKWGSYSKENYHYAKERRKHIRAEFRHLVGEGAHHPQKHEYHTKGWLTW